MKKILQYIYLHLLIISLFSSCDLNTYSTTDIEEDLVYTTTDNVDLILNGTWKYLMETFNSYANPGLSSIFRASDAMGPDVVIHFSKYGFKSHYQFLSMHTQTSGTVTLSWLLAYRTINNCNNIIARIDETEGSDEDKARIKGQAYALRGYMYLNLASFYSTPIDVNPNAPCAPIYLEPTLPSTEGKKRESVSAVYAQCISDLTQAENLIPTTYDRGSKKYKIDLQVVYGLLARANLYSQHWSEAEKYAAQAHGNAELMSETEYKAGFNDVTNIEWIWGHPQTTEQSNPSYNFHFLDVTSEGSYYKSFNADPYFMQLFDDSDYRKKLFVINDATPKEVYLGYDKFRFREPEVADIVLMRTSEMYLIEAEAKAHQAEKVEDAIIVLNKLKSARNAKLEATGTPQQQVIADILIERRKELFNEGFSLIDIIRTQGNVVRKQYTGGMTLLDGTPIPEHASHWKFGIGANNLPFEPNSLYYIFNYPNSELTNNPNLNN